jgi:hypothetical protein
LKTLDLMVARMDGRFVATRLFALTAATLCATMATSAVASAGGSGGIVQKLSQAQVTAPLFDAMRGPRPVIRPVVARQLVWQGRDVDGDGAADFVNPTGQAPRTFDAYGSGAFGASRDGGHRHHEGVDYAAQAGQTVKAPISGYVTKIGMAYASDPDLKFVEITNPALGYEARVFYIDPEVKEGQVVALGAAIGKAHTLQDRYPGGMTDHVHLELAKTRAQAKQRFDASDMIVARYEAIETTAD